MASSTPLQNSELIDCARANGKKGIVIAAQRCGYSDDIAPFQQALKSAGAAIEIEIQSFDDLITTPQDQGGERGIEIAPVTLARF